MFAIESVINYYQNKRQQSHKLGFCPNCWGHQNYQGQFLDVMKKDQINYKIIGERGGWMLAYVSSKLQGIRLKKNTLLEQLNFRRKKRSL